MESWKNIKKEPKNRQLKVKELEFEKLKKTRKFKQKLKNSDTHKSLKISYFLLVNFDLIQTVF